MTTATPDAPASTTTTTTTSAARIAANRRNAQRSTGPTTPEGKAASRLNATRHGLAGSEDGPVGAAAVARVEARTLALLRELGPVGSGEAGAILARRAAVLSLRMEAAARREFVVVARDRAAALAAFDLQRQERIEALLGVLRAHPDEPIPAQAPRHRAALRDLEALPEGIAPVIEVWQGLRRGLTPDDLSPGVAITEVAQAWLGLDPAATRGWTARRWRERIDEEIARLRSWSVAQEPARARIAQHRAEAGDLATFDPSPEACLARRYEATAQSGFFRTLKALRDLQATSAAATGPIAPPPSSPPPARSVPVSVPPPPRVSNPTPAQPSALGSFRSAAAPPSLASPNTPPSLAPSHPEARKRRPDPLQMARRHR